MFASALHNEPELHHIPVRRTISLSGPGSLLGPCSQVTGSGAEVPGEMGLIGVAEVSGDSGQIVNWSGHEGDFLKTDTAVEPLRSVPQCGDAGALDRALAVRESIGEGGPARWWMRSRIPSRMLLARSPA